MTEHRDRGRGARNAASALRQAEALQAVAARRMSEIRTGHEWEQMLAAAARHLAYGFTNAVLIETQHPGASHVETYGAWQEAGRQVVEGAAGIRVIAPTRDGAASVFDASQTSPRNRGADPAGGHPAIEGGEARIADVLAHYARHHGYEVRDDHAASPAHTDWDSTSILLHPGLPPGARAAALAHEITHVILDRHIPQPPGATTMGCYGVKAVEADSSAYLVCKRLGIAAATRFPSVASWAGADPRANPAATIESTGERISAAAAAICGHVEKILQALPPPPAAKLRATPRRKPPPRPCPPPGPPANDPEITRIAEVNRAAAAFFRSRLPNSWAPGYLASRGITPALQRQWQIGYAPGGWRSLTNHLLKAGYDDTLLQASGLARVSYRGSLIDVHRDRAVIPVHDHNGVLAGFIGRASPQAGDRTPKYVNTPATGLYAKGKVLFGLAEGAAALERGARPVIVEGPLDAIAVSAAAPGQYVGVAPCGTALTAAQVALLAHVADLRTAGVLVAFDPDGAGRRAAAKAYKLLHPATPLLEAAVMPAGQDPADVLKAGGAGAVARALAGAHPLADVAVDETIAPWSARLRWAEGQIGALHAVAAVIAQSPPADITRQVVRTARHLGLAHEEVTIAFTDAVASTGDAGPKHPAPPRAADSAASLAHMAGTAPQIAALDGPCPPGAATQPGHGLRRGRNARPQRPSASPARHRR